LCFSNYNDSQIVIAVVDLKTRRKTIRSIFKCQRKPTYIFQINE
jgi:hypothetical protein